MDIDSITKRPLGQVAEKIRADLRKAQTVKNLKSYASWIKRTKYGLPPLYCTPDMFVVSMSNTLMARFLDLDFSGALIGKQDDVIARLAKPANAMFRTLGADIFNMSWIMGRDVGGNYWLNCAVRKDHWPGIEKQLEKKSDSNIRARL
ncbi:Acetyltransferase adrJ [Cladobotryum mycophilum]|uniref:Acetyltransferase adrJ n=1 Tax=Cladobotryum mycophilum TaxID=491253 RepID=A0ABR0S9T9_9HYPO